MNVLGVSPTMGRKPMCPADETIGLTWRLIAAAMVLAVACTANYTPQDKRFA